MQEVLRIELAAYNKGIRAFIRVDRLIAVLRAFFIAFAVVKVCRKLCPLRVEPLLPGRKNILNDDIVPFAHAGGVAG